jgi:hypothetical protein
VTFIDTNILLRSVQTNDPQFSITENALDKLRARQETLCIAPQNLVEFWVVATRPLDENGLGMAPSRAAREITALLRFGFSSSPCLPRLCSRRCCARSNAVCDAPPGIQRDTVSCCARHYGDGSERKSGNAGNGSGSAADGSAFSILTATASNTAWPKRLLRPGDTNLGESENAPGVELRQTQSLANNTDAIGHILVLTDQRVRVEPLPARFPSVMNVTR